MIAVANTCEREEDAAATINWTRPPDPLSHPQPSVRCGLHLRYQSPSRDRNIFNLGHVLNNSPPNFTVGGEGDFYITQFGRCGMTGAAQ